jgi:hypothetical protein
MKSTTPRNWAVISATFLFASIILAACGEEEGGRPLATEERRQRLSPDRIIEQFKEGNKRFLAGEEFPRDERADQAATAKGQYPLAVVLSCIDSRAPAEHIFDAGIGDMF